METRTLLTNASVTLQLVELPGDLTPGTVSNAEEFDVEFRITDSVNDQSLFSGYADVVFDPNHLEVLSITHDSDYEFEPAATGTPNNTLGEIDELGGSAGLTPPTDSLIATIRFRAKSLGASTITTNAGDNLNSEIVSHAVNNSGDLRNNTFYGSLAVNDPIPGDYSISIADRIKNEGDTGLTPFVFEVTRSGDTSAATTVDYAVSGFVTGQFNDSAAQVADINTAFTGGTVSFAANVTSQQVTIDIVGDTVPEDNESFAVSLLNPSASGNISDGFATAIVLNDDAPPTVVALTAAHGGIGIEFSHPMDESTLNLYDVEAQTLGPSDVTVVGNATGAVAGSLVVDGANATFVPTVGPLPADTYTITLRSSANGFRSQIGQVLLDGNADLTAGDDYTNTFVLGAAEAVAISLPNFSRAAGQPVNVPASSTGLPITISGADAITVLEFDVRYDPELLTITGAMVGPDAPGAATIVTDALDPGFAVFTFTANGAIAAGDADLIRLEAFVPPTATAGAAHAVAITNVTVNGGAVPVTTDTSIHNVALFGDATGDGTYSSSDVQHVLRNAVSLDQGLESFPLIDPVIAVDVSPDGILSPGDVQIVLQEAIELDPDEIPDAPPVGPVVSGPSTEVNIPTDLTAITGGKVFVPVNITDAHDVGAADIVLQFDSSLLSFVDAVAGTLWTGNNVTSGFNDTVPGQLTIGVTQDADLTGGAGSLIVLEFDVLPAAVVGTSTPIDLVSVILSEGTLQVAPAPIDDVDPTDGLVRVIDAIAPTVTSIGLNTDQVDPADLPAGPQPSSWQQQRSEIRTIVVTLSEDVATITPSDLVLTNLGIDAPNDADSVVALQAGQLSQAGNVLTITFPNSGPDSLLDGVYRLDVLDSVTDLAGNALDGDDNGSAGGNHVFQGDTSNEFSVLAGDYNGSGGVNILDFATFSYWFNQDLPIAPGYVDGNDSGGVNILDFAGFSNNFNASLTYPAPLGPLSSSASTLNTGAETILGFVPDVGVVTMEGLNTVITVDPGTSIGFTASLDSATQLATSYQLNFENSDPALAFSSWANNGSAFAFPVDGIIEDDLFVASAGFTPHDTPPGLDLGTFSVLAPAAGGDYLLTANSVTSANDDTLISNASGLPISIDDFGDVIIRVPGGNSALSVTIADDSVSENGGTTTATVTRDSSTAADLVVTLSSNDTSEATVPASVTIPAGQTTSAPFTISGVDDLIVDGTQTVTVTASAASHSDGTDLVDVTDDDVAALTVSIADAAISENGGATTATVTRNTDTTNALTVVLTSNDLTEATVVAAGAATQHDESIDGDLSGDPASPTPLAFGLGENVVSGTMQNPSDTRDFFTFTVPAGYVLNELLLLQYEDITTSGPGNRGFHGINAGATSFIPSASTAASFLGGDHLDPAPAGTDLLPDLAMAVQAGTGFTTPLGPGTYSYIIQQTGPQNTAYSLSFNLAATIEIAAGQTTSPAFNIDAVDDMIVDGTQTVTITATEASHTDGTDTVDVTDDDAAALTVSIADASISENGGSTTATVSRNTDTTNALTVTLMSNDTSEATVLGSVAIAAGQTTSPAFNIDAVDDLIVDGTQTVTITATEGSHADGTDTVDVTDDDVAALTVSIADASISENGGSTTATVSRNTDTTNALAVTLMSSDTSEATVLGSVTIAAGQTTSPAFNIDAVDDMIVDGTQTVTITATEASHADGTDTVDVTDDDVAALTVSIADASISENGGSTTATVSRNTDTTNALTVALMSSDTSEATVLGSVTIAAGQTTSPAFNIDAVDDMIVDGTQTVTITATEGSHADGTDTVDVTDDDVAALTVSIADASISENGGSTTATVSRNTDTTNALTVALMSSDTSEATVLGSVTIAAGQTTSPAFNIDAVDDMIVDGTQTVTITATEASHADGTDTVDVTDDDGAVLAVSIADASISENGGNTTATVSRNTDITNALTVALMSSDTSEATVLGSVIIAAGQTTSPAFNIAAVDDMIVDGTQTVIITATEASHADGTDTVDVTDDDVAALTVSIADASISENGGSTTATVSRNTDTTNALTVTLMSNDTAEATVVGSVTIAAGQTTSPAFNIDAVDDLIVDGTQTVTITATEASHADGTDTVDVTDDDAAALTVSIADASISENGGSTTATVSRNTDTIDALTVALMSSDTSEATVLGSVTIAAGQTTSPAFNIDAVDDLIVDGTQTVTITATEASHADGTDTVDVTDDDGATLTITIADASISENGGSTTATVSRNTDTTNALTVTLMSNDTTEATVVGSVTIAAGQTTSPAFNIDAVDDLIVDGTQTVTITATEGSHADGTDTVDVTDDDAAALTVSIADASISENGGSTTATVSRNTDTTNALTVTLMSSDTSEATVLGSVTIAAGQTTSPAFNIDAVDDLIVDGTQTVTITATEGSHADGTDTVDVTDDDAAALTVSIADASISENGGSTTATVSRNTDTTNSLVVALMSDDTSEATVLGSVTIAAGQTTSPAFNIDAVDDLIVDGTQTVTITATEASHADGTDTVDVTDDDVAALTVSIADASISENGGSTTATVSRNTDTTNSLVVALMSDDTSEATVLGSVTIAAGETTSPAFNIDAVDDLIVDGTQTVTITATEGSHADGTDTVDVTDDDVAALTVSIVDASISENGGVTTATVTRNSDTSRDLVVTLSSNDTSEATVPASVTIPAGQTTSVPFAISGVDDLIVDGTQTVTVTASAASHGDGTDSVDVTDDDAVIPTVDLSLSVNSGSESAETMVTVTATASSAVSGVQTVDLMVTGTNVTSGDFNLSAAQITIQDGSDTGTVTFTILDDALVEALTETATLTISNPSSGIQLGTVTSQDVQIVDNDSAVVSVSAESKAEGTGAAPTIFTFTIDLSAPVDIPVGLVASTSDGSATSPVDYTSLLSADVIFNANDTTSQSISVDVVADSDVEPDEAFDLVLSGLFAPDRAVTFELAGSMLSVTADILNDDTPPVGGTASIIDDGDIGYSTVGDWTTVQRNAHQGDFDYADSGTGANEAAWLFNELTPGQYRVSISYRAWVNRATDAPFTVSDGAMSLATLLVDQTVGASDRIDEGTRFHDLGVFQIDSGQLRVLLTDAANGLVSADAVRIEPVDMNTSGPQINVLLDGLLIEGDTGVVDFRSVEIGSVQVRTLTVENVGDADLTISSLSLPFGFSLVSPPPASSIAPGASTTIAIQMDTSAVRQLSGEFSFDTNDADDSPFNISLSGDVVPAVRIVDNSGAGFSTVGNWLTVRRNGHRGGFAYSSAGSGADVARFTFDVSAGGRYRVSAAWRAHSNRATDAPFTVLDGATPLSTVEINQRVAPVADVVEGTSIFDRFQDLGTFTMTGGQLIVELSDAADGVVVADAIRIERID